jgi:drug/metabolite transporter (DMT)-like permease
MSTPELAIPGVNSKALNPRRGALPSYVGAFATIYLVWGTTFLAVEVGLRGFAPFQLMGVRSLLGGAILLGGLGVLGRGELRREWGVAATSGVLMFVGGHGLAAYAQQSVPSWLAAVMFALMPFWMAVFNPRQLGQGMVRLGKLGGLAVGFAGILLIAWADAGGGEGASDPDAIVILGVAAACWAIGTSVTLRRPGPGSAAALAGKQLTCGGVVLVAISLLAGESWRFDADRLQPDVIAALGWLVVCGSVVTLVAYQWLMDRAPATLVASYTFVNPAVAVIAGWLVLAERPAALAWAGIGLVIGAVAASLGVEWRRGRAA